MTIMVSASRAVQEPAALPIPVTGHGSGSAFIDRIHAKPRHVCATRRSRTGSNEAFRILLVSPAQDLMLGPVDFFCPPVMEHLRGQQSAAAVNVLIGRLLPSGPLTDALATKRRR